MITQAEPTAAPASAALPSFVIGGAPKSGTTAMAAYLRDHPAVWFADNKEPFYWAADLPALRKREGMQSRAAYASLFAGAGSQHTAIGEGSTLYLYSQRAIPDLLAEQPETKFVFMVRRPDEIAHAYHMQMRYYFYEDVEDFEEAWSLQEERAAGRRVPEACIEPALLQYGAIASVGSQVARAAELIKPENRLVLVFDDFRESPQREYRRVLEFLGLEDDGRDDFPKQNSAMAPRAAWLTKLMRSGAADGLTRLLKASLPGPASDAANRAKKWMLRKKADRRELSPEFRQRLKESFHGEVAKLEEVLGRTLPDWY